MSEFEVFIDHSDTSADVVCFKVCVSKSGSIGKPAKLTLKRRLRVKRGSGPDRKRFLWREEFVAAAEQTVHVPREKLGRGFEYSGEHFDIVLESVLEIKDSMVFDSRVKTTHEFSVLERSPGAVQVRSVAEPADQVSYLESLKSVGTADRWIAIGWLTLAGLAIVASIVLIVAGLVFQFRVRWGDLMVVSGIGVATAWAAARTRLRRYAHFELGRKTLSLRPDTRLPLRDLVNGRTRNRLSGATIRVVAYNVELGENRRKSAKKLEYFSRPVRAIRLFSQNLPTIPPDTPMDDFLDGEVGFARLFQVLYPPYTFGKNYGLDIQVEIQLLHGELVDQELIPRLVGLKYEDFLSQN